MDSHVKLELSYNRQRLYKHNKESISESTGGFQPVGRGPLEAEESLEASTNLYSHLSQAGYGIIFQRCNHTFCL
jgi:hypothetical protein